MSIDSELVKKIYIASNMKRTINGYLPSLILSTWLSIPIAYYSIKKRISPNSLTLMMIPFALIGSLLFSFSNLEFKIIGSFFIHTWFAIDKADGEVARCTNNFSLYGEELDFLIHHVCHFFLISSVAYNLKMLDKYPEINIAFLYALLLYCEYSFRNYCSLNHIFKIKRYDTGNFTQKRLNVNLKKNYLKTAVKFFINQLHCCDNYVLLATVLIYFDMYFELDSLYILSILFIICSYINTSLATIGLIRRAK